VRFEDPECDDAVYLIVPRHAARTPRRAWSWLAKKASRWEFPSHHTLAFTSEQLATLAQGKKGILVAEINAGQMVQDVRLAINGKLPVEHFGRLGGIVPDPTEIVNALQSKLMNQ
jgi:2-oxoglutarate ferredoxin oxidoreductase subunit alpha